MANYRRVARNAALRYGLDPGVFLRQINQESGFNPSVRSGAGAVGIAQFMPGTAKGLGVDPLNPVASLNAAAKLMAGYVHRFGNYADALRAYNAGPGAVKASHGFAETNQYVASILGGRNPSARGPRGGSAPGGPSGMNSMASGMGSQTSMGPQGSTLALLAALQDSQQKAAPASSGLQAPSFSAGPAMPQGAAVPQSSGGPAPKQDTSALLDLIRTQGADPTTITTGGGPIGMQGGSPPGILSGGRAAGVPAPAALKGIKGVAKFEGKPVAAWIAPVLSYARAHGWKGTVTSGYRSEQQQAALYAGRRSNRNPVAAPGTSNHEFTAFPGGAVDASDAAQLARILRDSPYRHLLRWAGSKDPVHFSHPHGGSY